MFLALSGSLKHKVHNQSQFGQEGVGGGGGSNSCIYTITCLMRRKYMKEKRSKEKKDLTICPKTYKSVSQCFILCLFTARWYTTTKTKTKKSYISIYWLTHRTMNNQFDNRSYNISVIQNVATLKSYPLFWNNCGNRNKQYVNNR